MLTIARLFPAAAALRYHSIVCDGLVPCASDGPVETKPPIRKQAKYRTKWQMFLLGIEFLDVLFFHSLYILLLRIPAPQDRALVEITHNDSWPYSL